MPHTSYAALLTIGMALLVIPGAYALSPHTQFESGIPLEEIQCMDEKILLESPRGTPACVIESVVDRLVQRGFVLVPIEPKDPEITPETESDVEAPDTSPPADRSSLLESDSEGEYRPTEKDRSRGVIIDPTNEEIKQLLSDDIGYEYAIDMPPEDPLALAQRIAAIADDKVIELVESKDIGRTTRIIYSTERGEISFDIEDYFTDNRSFLEYSIHATKGPLPDLDEFTQKIMDDLGIDSDESETTVTTEWDFGDLLAPSRGYKFNQELYGFDLHTAGFTTVHTKEVTVPQYREYPGEVLPERVKLSMRNWITNIDEINLIPIGFLNIVARSYAIPSEELQGPDCKIEYDPCAPGGSFTDPSHPHKKICDRKFHNPLTWSGTSNHFMMIEGRPIISEYSGMCTVSHEPTERHFENKYKCFIENSIEKCIYLDDEFKYAYITFVDAITGKPLYAKSQERGFIVE